MTLDDVVDPIVCGELIPVPDPVPDAFPFGINSRPIFFDEWRVNVDLFKASFNAIRHSWNETIS